MKKIEAVIFPSRLDAVRIELQRGGIHAMLTLTEVQQLDDHQTSISTELRANGPMQDRVKLELIVADRQAQRAMGIIRQYAQTATNGAAGHVSLLGVNEALQILPRLRING
jgi:nitrogen regulatory protein PII